MKRIFLLTVSLLLPVILSAKIVTTYVTAEGVGKSKVSATRNALIEAIKQTQGVAIASKRVYYKSIKEAAISVDGDSSHGISIDERSQKSIAEATRGFIRRYSIVDAYRDGGEWHVKVRVALKKYKSPGFSPNKRRRMAVIPFEYKKSYIILGNYENGKEVASRFTQSLVSKIVQSRKFTVLDRENSAYYKNEKNFILSGDSSKEEYLKLGKRLGTDYLLIGKLLSYKVGENRVERDLEESGSSTVKCSATISYRILMMSTQQIKWSETIYSTVSLPENSDLGSAEAIVAYTTDKLADIILKHILNNIYPPRVIMVTSHSIVINQGGNSIQNGAVYEVYQPGQRLVDPYTHEFLGYEEIRTGVIRVNKVRPKVSYATILSGYAKKGAILRLKKAPEGKKGFYSEGEKKADIKVTPGGGVVLPFD